MKDCTRRAEAARVASFGARLAPAPVAFSTEEAPHAGSQTLRQLLQLRPELFARILCPKMVDAGTGPRRLRETWNEKQATDEHSN